MLRARRSWPQHAHLRRAAWPQCFRPSRKRGQSCYALWLARKPAARHGQSLRTSSAVHRLELGYEQAYLPRHARRAGRDHRRRTRRSRFAPAAYIGCAGGQRPRRAELPPGRQHSSRNQGEWGYHIAFAIDPLVENLPSQEARSVRSRWCPGPRPPGQQRQCQAPLVELPYPPRAAG